MPSAIDRSRKPRRLSAAPMDKLSIYVPQEKRQQAPIERLTKLARNRDRSVNYLVVQAILDFVERGQTKDNGD